MKWVITQTWIPASTPSAPGRPRDLRWGYPAPPGLVAAPDLQSLPPRYRFPFMILDADEVLYFTGSATDEIFAPLDYVRDDYGAVSIIYLRGGTWREL